MTKQDITDAVHKSVSHTIKTNIDATTETLDSLLFQILRIHGVNLTQDAEQKLFELYCHTITISSLSTIRALFDLGLLNQELQE